VPRTTATGGIINVQNIPNDLATVCDSLAKAFSRLGWLGVWIQVTIGSIPLLLIIYSVVFGHSTDAGTRSRLLLIEYLTFASLLVLVFNTVWSYRYTRLAVRIHAATD
jgi:Protein of unknown function (DUF3611)